MKRISFLAKIFKKIVFFVSVVALILAVVVAITTKLSIPGGFRVYSVLTGSMQPSIRTGSLIFTKIPLSSREIQKDQIITFEQPGFENKFVTHRVHQVIEEKESRFFATKGDANNTPDSWLISYGRIKGVYRKHIPYLGYILEFIKSPFGIILFVIIPVAILVIEELKNIGATLLEMKLQKEMKNIKAGKKKKKRKHSLKLAFIVFFTFSVLGWRSSYALFTTSQSTQISSCSIITGSWGNSDSVVINEVYYDTTGLNEGDEFVEIYNPTSSTIDLTDYKVGDEETKGGGEGMYKFPAGTLINSGQFIILAKKATVFKSTFKFNPDFEWVSDDPSIPDMIKYSDWATGYMDLANAGDEVLLLDKDDLVVDVVTYESGSYGGITPHPGVVSGHSIARSPKGADTDDCSVDFVDNPSPNPGTNPHPSLQTDLDFYLRADKKAVGFTVTGILPFDNLDYEIVYEADGGMQGIVGSLTIPEGEDEITQNDLLLGTCSSLGQVCVYHTGVEAINLTVTLSGSGIPDRILEKTLEL